MLTSVVEYVAIVSGWVCACMEIFVFESKCCHDVFHFTLWNCRMN